MRMTRFIAMALCATATPIAAQQIKSSTPKGPVGIPKIAQGPNALLPPTITVTYTRTPTRSIYFKSDLYQMDVVCGPDAAPAGQTTWTVTCTTPVELKRPYEVRIGWRTTLDGKFYDKLVFGSEWGGDCTGTTKSTCYLTIDKSKHIIITPNSASAN